MKTSNPCRSTSVRRYAGALIASLLLLGCGDPVESLCQKQDEAGCISYADCIESADESRRDAEKAGCGSEFDSYAGCLDGAISADMSCFGMIAAGESECREQGEAWYDCRY